MARTAGRWQRWQARLKRFWRVSCRLWLRRRNLPYFVLAGLIGFLLASGARRRQGQPLQLQTAPQTAASANVTTDVGLHLGQSPEELSAAWEAIVAGDAAAGEAPVETRTGVDSFLRPCQGGIVLGRGWRKERSAWIYHAGVDLQVETGQPVTAIAAGKILSIAPDEEGGLRVVAEHADGWRSVYGRLGEVEVQAGNDVGCGEVVGSAHMGTVHIEVWHGRSVMDPLAVLPGLTP